MRTSTYILDANERLEIAASGDYVRVRESVADLLIEHPQTNEIIEVSQGDDFEFDEFKSLYITNTSASQVTVKLTISRGKKAGSAKVGGDVAIAGDVGLNSETLAAIETAVINAQPKIVIADCDIFYADTNLAAGGNVMVLDPSLNTNGAILHAASFSSFADGGAECVLIGHTAAPTSHADGSVLLASEGGGAVSGFYWNEARLVNKLHLPAGMGLYFFAQSAEFNSNKHAIYELL